MDVTAYTYGTGNSVQLGNIAQQIWTQGFRFSEDRTIQVSKPINAAAPNLFDRLTRVQNFQFAAGRAFTGTGATVVAMALQFMTSHPAAVPTVADLQFQTQGNGEAWLRYCAIKKVELVQKVGALVVFGYTIEGGIWASTRS